ncbi:hypothetical protein HY570_01635 [Candidatus Micrarchaeota archaeon]|nr:hypothetical protein [Candidatus Micrarchaeota archaeon]
MNHSDRRLEYLYTEIEGYRRRISTLLTDINLRFHVTYGSQDELKPIAFRDISARITSFYDLFNKLKDLIIDLTMGEKTTPSLLELAGTTLGELLNHAKEVADTLKPIIHDRQHFDGYYKKQASIVQGAICDIAQNSLTHPENVSTILTALYISYHGKSRIYETIEEIFREMALLQTPKRLQEINSRLRRQSRKLKTHITNLGEALEVVVKPEQKVKITAQIQETEKQLLEMYDKLSIFEKMYREKPNIAVTCVVAFLFEIATKKPSRAINALYLLDNLLSSNSVREPTIDAIALVNRHSPNKIESVIALCDKLDASPEVDPDLRELSRDIRQELQNVQCCLIEAERMPHDPEKIRIFERAAAGHKPKKVAAAFQIPPGSGQMRSRLRVSG